MALRLALALEIFASECADRIQANDNAYHDNGEQFPDWTFSLPSSPLFPEDLEGWRSVEQTAASNCLSFAQKVRYEQELLNNYIEHGEPDDEFSARSARSIGLNALTIATALRHEYDLRDAQHPWAFEEFLRRRSLPTN